MRRLQAHDEAAFVELVERYHAALRRLARVFVSTNASAEEIVQDAWMVVVSGVERFEARSSLRTWLFAIVANRARSRAVREHRMVPASSTERDEDGPAVDPSRFGENGRWARPPGDWNASTPETLLVRRDAVEALRRAVETLPERQRAAVVLRDLEGLPSEEVCNILGIAETNLRVMLHRARARLRTVLEETLGGRVE